MKFYYTIETELEKEIILKLSCPYIIKDFARSLMQQFVASNQKLQDLQDGVYYVNMYKETQPIDEEVGATYCFIKHAASIKFFEKTI